ncbi:hypothetical protein [Actinoplanes teichomyceticus]|uniref:DUF2567 domain-containing protein n=1 Tax=Actinoplanes teichomyceticus TaxID=1867 RepID=A0A561WJ63_ACTTI|nr:hypothetical protein [Actinoplanes teichomyceticus]TWG23898.1 hypothetical protein FHX34_102450 [Actinoplanes teichomyceticus]GIF11942.1 hypothetical protein Ate01nite_19740 [Actinoplanes teichomyceticus]
MQPEEQPEVVEQPAAPIEHPAARPPWWRLQQGPRRPWRRVLGVAFGSGAVVAVLGVPLGLLWHALAPGVPVIDAGDNGLVVNDPSPEQYIAADGWMTLLGIGFGLLVAITAWLVLRRDRGPALMLGVVIGAGVAAQGVAAPLGEMFGRDAYDHWRATAAQGATYLAPAELHSIGPTLVPAFVAAIVLTLLAGWSNDPDLDHPGAQPGYGPNHGQYDDAYPAYHPVSSGWPAGPDPTAAPAPPAPGPADRPRG